MENKDKNCETVFDYPLTTKQRGDIYLSQKGCCKLFNKPVLYDKMKADHKHSTGRFRGLLCHSCNIKIGILEGYQNDNFSWWCNLPCQDFIKKALRYLE